MFKKIVVVTLIISLFLLSGNKGYAKKYEEKYKIDVSHGEHVIDRDETLTVSNETMYAARKSFGLVAKNVKYLKMSYNILLLAQNNNENLIYQIDLLKKEKNKSNAVCYKKYKVTDDAKEIYPIGDSAMFFQNKKHQICYTGVGTCDLMFQHTSAKTCDKESEHQVRNKFVLKNVKKCWGDTDMFAYVKENKLYITGWALKFDTRDKKNSRECYERQNVKSYFEGKGNKVEQVIYGYDKEAMIFVLMKDGSVWGMGDNSHRLIKDTKTKTYMNFVEVIPSGVKQIATGEKNIGFLKKDNTLWVRGKGFQERKREYSYKLRKIASDVTEFCLPSDRLLFLKRDGTAYGMGQNEAYALTSQYNTSWVNKPVKLMDNVKHVYGNNNMTFVLTKNNNLYWRGEQGMTYSYWW